MGCPSFLTPPMVRLARSLRELIAISHFYGKDPDYVIEGGGNTSVKIGSVLHVKASGARLGSIEAKDFVALDRAKVAALLELDGKMEEHALERIVAARLLEARLDPQGGKPSVESVLHNLVEAKFVVHTHATLVNGFSCCADGQNLIARLFDGNVLWIPYVNPGLRLALAIARRLVDFRARKGRDPLALIFENHGLFVAADSPREVRRITNSVLSRLRAHLRTLKTPVVHNTVAAPAADPALIAPLLRGALADGGRLPLLRYDGSPEILALVADPHIARHVARGPVIPDVIVYCRSFPLVLEPQAATDPARLLAAVENYRRRHKLPPKVVLVRATGMFTAGENAGDCATAALMYRDAARIIKLAGKLGGLRGIGRKERAFIDSWDAEAYRRAKASSATEGRLKGRVALVTGAARGIGADLARGLASAGAHVVCADMDHAGARQQALEAERAAGRQRALAAQVDVRHEDSIAKMLRQTILAYGGVDLLVSNAGVVRAGGLMEMAASDFDFVNAVNYRAFFLCAKHAARCMAATRSTCPAYGADIVQINSKSGLEGSSRNSAYAGSKFASLGLVQSFALELAPLGIKVNAVCPGNYLDGPLWSDPEQGLFAQYLRSGKVPGAKTSADVRAAYEAKVPMRRGVLPADILKAVLYLAEQAYETGQALPVTGGQVMLR